MSLVEQYCPKGSRVCDIFAGTLAVSFELKRRGFFVIANDINLFSSVIGKAFIVNNEIPSINLRKLLPVSASPFRGKAKAWAATLIGKPGFQFLQQQEYFAAYVELLALLCYLQQLRLEHLPKDLRRTDFYDTYTEGGKNSQFLSQRGRSGRRRFFSDANGLHIDAMLNQIRFWRRNQFLHETVYNTLLSSLIRAVEKVSNTQGTYHDFPREEIDPRALNPLKFEPPPFDTTLKGGEHIMGQAEDSLSFIQRAPSHSLIYIDPPYNFRQYTAYYFLPNLICRYSDIQDLDNYFSKVEFVRGQNMEDDFISPFCRKPLFLSSLEFLVTKAPCQWVALSYFDGRNHWNDFKSEADTIGFEKLKKFFGSSIFRKKTLKVEPVKRINYQSYGGYKAKEISEYLFIAEKS
jgi:adenine-specific DNA methylase